MQQTSLAFLKSDSAKAFSGYNLVLRGHHIFAAIVGTKSSLPTGELGVGEEDLSGHWTIWKSFELMSIIRLWLLNVAPISHPIIKIIFDNFRVVAIEALLASLEKTAYLIGQLSISQLKTPTFK